MCSGLIPDGMRKSREGPGRLRGNRACAPCVGRATRKADMSDGTIVVTASVGKWGFFTGEAPVPPTSQETLPVPDNIRQDRSIVHVESLEHVAQFFRVTLTTVPNGAETQLVVVSASPPFPVQAIADATRRLLRVCVPAPLCMIVEDRRGWASATSPSDAALNLVAAAVAHTNVTGGWDESDPVLVDVNGQTFQVSAQLQANLWQLVARRA
jgi:hypothetical protein